MSCSPGVTQPISPAFLALVAFGVSAACLASSALPVDPASLVCPSWLLFQHCLLVWFHLVAWFLRMLHLVVCLPHFLLESIHRLTQLQLLNPSVLPSFCLPGRLCQWVGAVHWMLLAQPILNRSFHILCSVLALVSVQPCGLWLPLGVIALLHQLAVILLGVVWALLLMQVFSCVNLPLLFCFRFTDMVLLAVGFCLVSEALSQ